MSREIDDDEDMDAEDVQLILMTTKLFKDIGDKIIKHEGPHAGAAVMVGLGSALSELLYETMGHDPVALETGLEHFIASIRNHIALLQRGEEPLQ